MKMISIIHRILREGKSFDDFRKAWFHTQGFGVPTQMHTVINTFNPREIISIGVMDIDEEKYAIPDLLKIDREERLASPLDDIVEETIVRHFGIVVAEDDFSKAESLTYLPPMVDGQETNVHEVLQALGILSEMITKSNMERDAIKNEEKNKSRGELLLEG
ncbi:MAG: hypothetical protein CO120_03195 [Gammaproteobacteria bacterium CG_4_9_14_3_um_filter_38_9]|nr:MAG: hypothetical protein CO120_03195 [Gammaproteobacteria bacterium CG_4_9_14_3_um_filter_38_9]